MNEFYSRVDYCEKKFKQSLETEVQNLTEEKPI